MYWGTVTAMLKGWLDRVFTCGFAWGFGSIFKTGLLKGKTALLITTLGLPEAAYQKVYIIIIIILLIITLNYII